MDPDKTNMEDDEFMAAARLQPDKISYPGKDRLRKTAADFTDTQIEYLSVACLEKDISSEQLQELEINLKENSESRVIFDTYTKNKTCCSCYHIQKQKLTEEAYCRPESIQDCNSRIKCCSCYRHIDCELHLCS